MSYVHWSEDEDLSFIALLGVYIIQKGYTISEAFRKISAELNRSVPALSHRWHTNLKQKLSSHSLLMSAIEAGKESNPSEWEP